MSKQAALLESGAKLFAEKGYSNTKVSDIVAEAGVAQGTFYLYFDSKKSLLISLVEQFYALLIEAIAGVVVDFDRVKSTADFATRIRLAVSKVTQVYKNHPALTRVCLREASGPDPDLAELWATVTSSLIELGASILDQAIEHELLPPQNTKIAAHCVIGMHERIAYTWLTAGDDFEFEEMVTALTRFEMLGIGGTASPELEMAITGEYEL